MLYVGKINFHAVNYFISTYFLPSYFVLFVFNLANLRKINCVTLNPILKYILNIFKSVDLYYENSSPPVCDATWVALCMLRIYTTQRY